MNQTARDVLLCLLIVAFASCARAKPGIRPGGKAARSSDVTPTKPETPPAPEVSPSSPAPAPNPAARASPGPASVAGGADKLGFDLLSRLAESDPKGNVFISPVSIALSLGMAWNGAAGSTEAAMAKVLGLPDTSREAIRQEFAGMVRNLQSSDTALHLDVANSLWVGKRFPLVPDFVTFCRQSFAAEVDNVDFESPDAAAQINNWVSRKTQGKITRIVDQTNALDAAFLINAVYFKARWSRTFDDAKPGPFAPAGGKTESIPVMRQSGEYSYLRGPDFQAAALPYGTGRIRMYAFLPDPGVSLDSLTRELKTRHWNSWLAEFVNADGSIVLPKFKLEYAARLDNSLKALGMAEAFDPNRASFSRLCRSGPQPHISEVLHKTFVEVNEKGTEAAAVTSTRIMCTALPPRPHAKFSLVIDRPFLAAIYDSEARALLFLGAIRNPKTDR
jgi:serpin B